MFRLTNCLYRMWWMYHLISPSGYHQCNGVTNSIYLLRLLGGLGKIMYVNCFEQTGMYSFYVSFCCCFCSVSQLRLTLCDPMICSTPGFPVLPYIPEFAQTHVHWVSDTIQPSHSLSPPSPPAPVFPRIRVSSNESALRIRWPQYWNFSFTISPSKWIFRVDFL